MARAPNIDKDGAWKRSIPPSRYNRNHGWRTDLPISLLTPSAKNVVWKSAHYFLSDGRTVIISANDLRTALRGIGKRNKDYNTNNFYIDPKAKTVYEHVTRMRIRQAEYIRPIYKTHVWSRNESEWHKCTKQLVAARPDLIGLNSDIADVWVDSCYSKKGKHLWARLWSSKRPDVVFSLHRGGYVVVEVEPINTIYDGIAQLAGDYVTSLQVDLFARSSNDRRAKSVSGVLVINKTTNAKQAKLIRRFGIKSIVIPNTNLISH